MFNYVLMYLAYQLVSRVYVGICSTVDKLIVIVIVIHPSSSVASTVACDFN